MGGMGGVGGHVPHRISVQGQCSHGKYRELILNQHTSQLEVFFRQ